MNSRLFVCFHSGAVEVSVLLGCRAMSLDDWCLKLQTALSHIQGSKMSILHGLLVLKDVTNNTVSKHQALIICHAALPSRRKDFHT